MSFEVIDTQEKLDSIISERLRREREATSKKIADYEEIKQKNADYEKQIGELTKAAEESAKKYSGFDKQLAEMQAKIKGYETGSVKTRIAHEKGIPFEFAERLKGETEEEIRQDAEAVAKLMGKSKPLAPLRSSETSSDVKTAALKAFTSQIISKE